MTALNVQVASNGQAMNIMLMLSNGVKKLQNFPITDKGRTASMRNGQRMQT